MVKYKPRLGDVVEYNLYNEGIKVGIVAGTEDDWYCFSDHIDIDGHVLNLKFVKRLIFRLPEEVIDKLEHSKRSK